MKTEPGLGVSQNVTAVAGFAYGVIGADLHVFGDGTPLYLLEEHRPHPVVGRAWLRELPSRMLDARVGVVAFTGRERERADLYAWRESKPRLAVRWLHAPGGQGKTRLADEVAADAAADGWKVAVAVHGVGAVRPSPGSQDLRLDRDRGVLLIVDYADRWPLSALIWLLRNSLLHQPGKPARVLLVARSAAMWPALRATLQDPQVQAGTSQQHLEPLSADDGDRRAMFAAARDSFAAVYQVPDPAVVQPPFGLEHPDFGLTLTVHLAALVAVDAHATGRQPAPHPDQLTGYLLARERNHWTRLDEEGRARGLDHQTPASVMARVVFTAALTGSLPHREAVALLDRIERELPAERLLTDHGRCYPPTDPSRATVLEPLYPDRLAEDFLALCLPGHHVPDHTPESWAEDILTLLLTQPTEGACPPPYAARAITFLTAASERWPHLIDTLEAIEPLLPDDPGAVRGDLAVAVADLAVRLAPRRLAAARKPAGRAEVYDNLGQWLDRAGRTDKATEALTEATRLYRDLSATDPTVEPRLARAALHLAQSMVSLGMALEEDAYAQAVRAVLVPRRSARPDEALAAFREAVETFRRLARDNPAEYEEELVAALFMAAFYAPHLGQPGQAVEFAREADERARRLAHDDPDGREENAAPYTLITLAATLADLQPAQAEEVAREAVDIARQLSRDDPAEHGGGFSAVLAVQAAVLLKLGKVEEALAALHEAAAAESRHHDNPDHRGPWFEPLSVAIGAMWVNTSTDNAPAALGAALQMLRRLAGDIPDGCAPALLQAFLGLSALLTKLGRWEEILVVQREMIDLLRSDEIPHTDDSLLDTNDIVGVLGVTSSMLAGLGRWEEALTAVNEAAAQLRAEDISGALEHCLGSVVVQVAATLADLESDDTTISPYQRMARDEALVVLNQMAATYRQLASANPAEYEPGLAVTLKILSESLWILGNREESLATGQEAVRLRRRLAEDGAAEHQEQLAHALFRLADKLTDLGRHEEAAADAGQAADIRRRLALDDPAEHQAALAAALHLVARNLGGSRPQEAVDPAGEAAGILVRLARDDPAEHALGLAFVLENLAGILRRLGRAGESVAAMSRAIPVYRWLAERDSAAHRPHLARGLWDLALMRAADEADLPGAWAAINESVALYTGLATDSPSAFTAALRDARAMMEQIRSQLSHVPTELACPMPGAILPCVVGADRVRWLVLVDPTWQATVPEEAPPDTVMIGGWRLDDDGRRGPFQPNPGYVPAHPEAPTDPTDFVLRLAALGEQVGEELVATIRGSVLEIACDAQNRPLVVAAPDGVACVLVVTAGRHQPRLPPEARWWPVPGSRLPEIVPTGLDVLINPGGPARFRLIRDALRAD